MNSAAPTVNLTRLLGSGSMGRVQIGIVVLCAFSALFDGYDLQVIGLTAPAIVHTLAIPMASMGSVFSAALGGLAIGSFVLGPLSDRIGRKKVLIAATLCFSVFTLATPLARSLDALLLARLLTGFGLGGAIPSFIALASEYAPQRQRAVVAALIWVGFPLGGVLGGLLGSWLIPDRGWQWMFWIGGALPIVMVVIQAGWLPESVSYLVYSGAPAARIAALLSRVTRERVSAEAHFVLGEERAAGGSVGQLFSHGRAWGTLLLWISCFVIYMQLVTNSSWSPTLLSHVGVPVRQSALAMAVFNLGNMIGTSSAGWLLTRFGGARVLPLALAANVVAYGTVGYAAPNIDAIVALQSFVGVFTGIAVGGLIAISTLYYPAPIRSTGVGWSMGVGRVGSFLGPLVVGALVGAGCSVTAIFALVAAPALIAAVAAGLIPRQDYKTPAAMANVGMLDE